MNEAVKMPQHVAIIMDGNGRWAAQHKVSRLQGHNRGMLVMKEIIKKADVMGIRHLTVYAFSTENWKRSQEEVGGIFNLLVKFVGSELAELDQNNVKVHILGDYTTADYVEQYRSAVSYRLKLRQPGGDDPRRAKALCGGAKRYARAGGHRRKSNFGEPLYGCGERQCAGPGSDYPYKWGTTAL